MRKTSARPINVCKTRRSSALLRVELDAALVAIDGEEVSALTFEERRPPAARLIAVARPFHFDDIGT